MSRLDSMIRRLCAQRDCLDWAVPRAPDGDFIELGLGNGRTYDHLRALAPNRRIWVIDKFNNAHPTSQPPVEMFLQGDGVEMLRGLSGRIGRGAALIHFDFGVGIPAEDARIVAAFRGPLRDVLAPGGYLLTTQRFDGFTDLPTPDSVKPGKFFIQTPGM